MLEAKTEHWMYQTEVRLLCRSKKQGKHRLHSTAISFRVDIFISKSHHASSPFFKMSLFMRRQWYLPH